MCLLGVPVPPGSHRLLEEWGPERLLGGFGSTSPNLRGWDHPMVLTVGNGGVFTEVFPHQKPLRKIYVEGLVSAPKPMSSHPSFHPKQGWDLLQLLSG